MAMIISYFNGTIIVIVTSNNIMSTYRKVKKMDFKAKKMKVNIYKLTKGCVCHWINDNNKKDYKSFHLNSSVFHN